MKPGVPTIPTDGHFEVCPFCGQRFDRRQLNQVIEHQEHAQAAGAPAPLELETGEETMRWLNTDASWEELGMLYRDLETVAFREECGSLHVETPRGRERVLIGDWLLRRADGTIEVMPDDSSRPPKSNIAVALRASR